MGEMDQGVKRLLQTFAGEILAFVVPGIAAVAPLPPEVATGPQLMPDAAYTALYQGEKCIINVEVQLHGDPEIPRRCFEYGSRLSIAQQLPVVSVVLWLEAKGQFPDTPYRMRIGDRVTALWEFVSVKVFDLSARAMIASGVTGLLPLVPFMREADIPAIEDAARLLMNQAPAEHVGDMESLLALFVARYYDADLALAILRRIMMNTDIVEQSPLYQLWRKQSTQTATRELTILALEGRFGALDAELVQAINNAAVGPLRQIIARVATITLDEVRLVLPSA